MTRRPGGPFVVIDSTAITEFVRESNKIEGIHRPPTPAEVMAHEHFLARPSILIDDLMTFVAVVAPGKRLRTQPGMDVTVGMHTPPPGGPEIARALMLLLVTVNGVAGISPYAAHVEYETLHPFMDGNGRSGRVLWLWMMKGVAPLGFLHTWYYQSLDHRRGF